MNPFKALIDLFLPRVCHVCETKLIDDEEYICPSCLGKLPLTGYERYWDNKTGTNTDLNPMEQRFAGQLPLGHACAPYFYTRVSTLASLVHDFKYRGFPNLALTLGRIGAELLKDSELFTGVDVILPIPIHWTKKRKRGYNQSDMIARGISDATGIPVGRQLKAIKPHRTQTSLNPEQRIANTKNVFAIRNPETLEGKTVMIVDDICTTGATLLSAGNAIAASTNHNVRLSFFTLGVV